MVCISYFSAAVTKHYDQSILEREGFILAMVPEAEESVMVGRRGGEQARQQDPEAESSRPSLLEVRKRTGNSVKLPTFKTFPQ